MVTYSDGYYVLNNIFLDQSSYSTSVAIVLQMGLNLKIYSELLNTKFKAKVGM